MPSTKLPSIKTANKSAHKYAIVIGIGLALFPIHNKWLTDVTSIEGMATLFLPALGAIMWILGTLLFLRDNWDTKDWGDKRVFVPLLVIVGAIGISGLNYESLSGKVAPLFMGLSMFSLYLVSRKLGKDIFLPLAIGVCIASVGILITGIFINPGTITGGLVFERNYDIAAGFVLLGTALFVHKYQWMLASLALLAMLVSGSPEGVFAITILVVVVLFRRDWSKKLLIALSPVLLAVVVLLASGYGSRLYEYSGFIIKEEFNAVSDKPLYAQDGTTPIGRKVQVAVDAMTNLKPLGEGYYITAFTYETTHNVPLLIVQQLGYPGILAALCWLWVTMWCLWKTKYKYVFVLILSLSVWDHYLFTQIGIWWYAAVGVATAKNNIESDLIFRKT